MSQIDSKMITQEKIPLQEYFNELTNNQIGLSLNGAAEICNRDFEILAARSVLFRPQLNQILEVPLIPNVH